MWVVVVLSITAINVLVLLGLAMVLCHCVVNDGLDGLDWQRVSDFLDARSCRDLIMSVTEQSFSLFCSFWTHHSL